MLAIILIIIIVLVVVVVIMYNGLVKKRIAVDNAWSQIDVQLQRRFDLIPNFVETVKGYMNHETDVLTKVTELRTQWQKCTTVAEKANVDNELSTTLKTIMAVSENYPDLKANQNFEQLAEELRNTENKIAFSRQYYNDCVTRYNSALQTFPSNIIASMFHFDPKQLFELAQDSKARENVKVDFSK